MLSKDFAALDRKFMEIEGKMKRLNSIERDFYLPERFGKEILADIKNALAASEKAGARKEYEQLLLMNFRERVNSLEVYLENQLSGKREYVSELKGIDLQKPDIMKVKSFAESFNPQKIAYSYVREVGNLFWKNAITEAEIEKIKDIINMFLKISFENSHLKDGFKTFSKYGETIEISQHSERSYHHYGKVYFSVQNFQFAGFYKGNKYIEHPDVFVAARVIGEEGLFGHQGQYLTTAHSSLPNFMKIPSWSSPSVNECIGNLGKDFLADIAIRDGSVEKMFSDIIPILKKENVFLKRKSFIKHFVTAIQYYLMDVEKSSSKDVGEYLSGLTGWKYFKSDFYRKSLDGYYSYDFLFDFRDEIQKWAYLYADYLSEKIQKRIGKFNENEKMTFLKNVMTGYWSKNTFEKYVDWLLKK